MDGIAEKTAIVNVATRNCFETLDKALSERPSRFDRIFRITRPTYQQRAELVKHISEKIPLSEDVREYIVEETNDFTPAQIQEVLHSTGSGRPFRSKCLALAIAYPENPCTLVLGSVNLASMCNSGQRVF